MSRSLVNLSDLPPEYQRQVRRKLVEEQEIREMRCGVPEYTQNAPTGNTATDKGQRSQIDSGAAETARYADGNCVIVRINARGKPRMTKKEALCKNLPKIRRWFEYKNSIIRALTHIDIPKDPAMFSWRCYFDFPKSYSKKKCRDLTGQIHRVKPDRDNIDKGLMDILFRNDHRIAKGTLEKYWNDGYGARIELYWS